MYEQTKYRHRLELSRQLFDQLLGSKRKMFRARLSKYRSDYITLDGGEVVRSIWRSWKAHNWIYQVDGELWAITHPADRLKWQ
jgi:hypothetical protein